jgi:hypothetical protein
MKNWYIGQRIVALRDHPGEAFKVGDEFVIQGLKNSYCKCNSIDIDIGAREEGVGYCNECGATEPNPTDVCWFSELNFSPLDEIESAISELMESVNVVEV